MTAYLQPGDVIHLVIPMPMKHGSPDLEQTRQAGNDLSRLYASQGVTVASCDASSTLTVATVVAVFRKPPPASQAD